MSEAFNETTDLYLQLLRKAQEVEDPRLIGMILERLKQGSPQFLSTDFDCVVIPFPISGSWPESQPAESRFWPRVAAAQVGCLVAFYALLVVGHSIFV